MPTYELRKKTSANTSELMVLSSDCVDTSNFSDAIYVVGNTTGTSPAWTATSNKITSYKDGMMIMFKIGIAGLSGTQTTLNINNLGAKKVFENNTTNPSTHYVVGAVLFMVYDSTADNNNGAWKIAADRTISDSQNVRTYNYSDSNNDRDLLVRQDTAAITSGSYTAKYVATTSHAKINTSTGKITSDSGFAVTNGTSSQFLKADGSTDNNSYALVSDIPTVNNGQLTLQFNGSNVQTFTANQSTNATANIQALPNFSLNISHQTAGNPRQVKFLTIDYNTKATYFKMSATSCHDNGTSYQFLEDIIIGCTTAGVVVCNVYKYCQATVTLDNVTRNYGDVFYVIDETNKLVDFYILCGQYASSQFTPATKIGNTTIQYITQYSGTATYYSSGTKVWANGDSTTYALRSQIPTLGAVNSNVIPNATETYNIGANDKLFDIVYAREISNGTYGLSTSSIIETVSYFSKENLLINSDFNINQRGSSYTTSNGYYFVDRWMFRGSGRVSLVNGHIELTGSSPKLYQYIDDTDSMWGKKYTLSTLESTGSYFDGGIKVTLPSTKPSEYTIFNTGAVSSNVLFGYDNSKDKIFVSMGKDTNGNGVIYGVKLEEGEHQTYYNKPIPELELLKCKRYYRQYYTQGLVGGTGRTYSYLYVNLYTPMRYPSGYPTIKFTANTYPKIILSDGSEVSVTGFSVQAITDLYLKIRLEHSSISGSIFTLNEKTLFIDAEIY